MNFIEIKFDIQGKTLPADHGYTLYSAIKSNLQNLDNSLTRTILQSSNGESEKSLPSDVLISSISGIHHSNRIIKLNQRISKFKIRCPDQQMRPWYCLLQNQVLSIGGHLIRLVQPKLGLIQPSNILKARNVIFKLEFIDNDQAPKYFLESCQKALDRLDISAQVYIDSNEHGDLARRSLKVKQKHIVGYGVVVEGLSDEDSIKLQNLGMGGRKHFGCGWFYPVKELKNEE
jgi:CRISPR-associated protein Cas6